MSFFSKLFGSNHSAEETSLPADVEFCQSCGEEVDPEELDDGMCEDCLESSAWSSYCCGQIYENGETTCMSCGDPL